MPDLVPATQAARFSGSSDDLIEVEGVTGGDEFGATETGDSRIAGVFNLGGRMRVYAIYDGCWSFAVGQVHEKIPLPDWPVHIGQADNGYSTRLEVTVPGDVMVFRES